jgi:hypothetical protein
MFRFISAYSLTIVIHCYYALHIIYSCTYWVPTISVLNIAIFFCYSNLLLRRWRWNEILWWGVLSLRCPDCFPVDYGVFWCFAFTRVILVFDGQYLYNNYTLFMTFGYLWTLLIRVCRINDLRHTFNLIWVVLGCNFKSGMTISDEMCALILSFLAWIGELMLALTSVLYD